MRQRLWFTVSITCVLGFSPSLFADLETANGDWRGVIHSQLIASGVLHVPQQELKAREAEGKPVAVKLNLDVEAFLKGSAEEQSLSISTFVNSGPFSFPTDVLIKLDGQKVLAFLNASPRLKDYQIYSVCAFSQEARERFGREIAEQERILRDFDKEWNPRKVPHYREVKKLVEQLRRTKTASIAFERLQTLGTEGVPAMILLLDDSRPMPIQSVAITMNNPNAFESVCHSSVGDNIHDALGFILRLITQEGFGGTQAETVNGWRVYLHHFAALEPTLRAKERPGAPVQCSVESLKEPNDS